MRTNGLTQTNNNTKVSVSVNIDGSGKSKISTDCSFLNHLLHVFSLYSKCDIYLNCDCSKKCGYQHQIDDIASALGSAVKASLGDRRGIIRFADSTVPMDDALVLCAIDISGRDYLSFDVDFPSEKIEDFDTELIRSFFSAFVRNSDITIHISKLSGINSHHITEAVFKAFALTFRKAVMLDDDFKNEIPSTKGV